MIYEVTLFRRGKVEVIRESVLDGLYPARTFDLMQINFVRDEMGICNECDADWRTHICVLDEDDFAQGREAWRILCPILFFDVLKLPYKVKDLA